MNKQLLIETAQWIRDNCIVIDTETTGLGENDTIVELAAVCPKTREPLIDILVKPLAPMSAGAEKTHGISMPEAHLSGWNAHSAITTLHELCKAKKRYRIASYNLHFDTRMVLQTAFKTSHEPAYAAAISATSPDIRTTCIMELANRYLHEHLEWKPESSQFRRLSLEKCLEITGIQREGQAHRALSDALAAADLLNYIAEGKQP